MSLFVHAELGLLLTGADLSFLTAAVALLVTAVQTVVVSVALPQGPYAALIVTLELIAFTPLRLQGAAGGFWRRGGLEGGV